VDEVRGLVMGDPQDPRSFLGPMFGAAHRCRSTSVSGRRRARGCCAVVKRRRASSGFYVPPTLFADVDNRMRIAQEEIFGPVLCLIPMPTRSRGDCPGQ
jgi:aldehyde dehydrogenase (NAD+)